MNLVLTVAPSATAPKPAMDTSRGPAARASAAPHRGAANNNFVNPRRVQWWMDKESALHLYIIVHIDHDDGRFFRIPAQCVKTAGPGGERRIVQVQRHGKVVAEI